MKKIVLLLLALVVALYLIAYLGLRLELVFVHRAAWITPDGNQSAKVASHQVDSGDPGIPSGPAGVAWAGVMHWGFAPLRWAEERYWLWRHPIGADWPYPR